MTALACREVVAGSRLAYTRGPMRDEIEDRYRLNLQRVRKLVDVYRELAGAGSGRRSVETGDLLRAAVVFLHASLEDVLRALLVRKWVLSSEPAHFEQIPFALGPSSRPTKVTLAELAVHRGRTVEQIIQSAIEVHLDRATFNNLSDVKIALARGGVDVGVVDPHARAVAAMMSRRHQIVHRADRRDVPGSGNHAAASLGVGTVNVWLAAIDAVCQGIVANL